MKLYESHRYQKIAVQATVFYEFKNNKKEQRNFKVIIKLLNISLFVALVRKFEWTGIVILQIHNQSGGKVKTFGHQDIYYVGQNFLAGGVYSR